MSTFLLALLASQAPCGWDLATDWSDSVNPNGVWSYNAGASAITTSQSNWLGSGSAAWAAAPSGFSHIPAWARVTPAGQPTFGPDATIGTIVMHSNDPVSGTDVDFANVTWTSPISANLPVNRAVWQTDAHTLRDCAWRLFHNGVLLDSGFLGHGDAFGPLAPRAFSFPLAIAAGDVVKLEFQRAAFYGTFCCAQLAITRSSLFLRGPVSGSAGSLNTFEIRGATPSSSVRLGYSLSAGVIGLPGCSGSNLCLSAPQLLATLTSDVNGIASFARQIPPSLSGRTVWFQAAELGVCHASNLVRHTFG